MAEEIRQTNSSGLITGTLSENGLKVEDSERFVNNKSVKCKRITGNISIETVNGTFKFQAPNFCYSIKADGTENNQFKSWLTVANEYKDKTTGDADVVSLSVRYAPSFSYNRTKDDVVLYENTFSSSFINRVDKSTESSTDIKTECVIDNIRMEMVNEEETGRLLVTILTINYGDADTPTVAIPSTLIVPEEFADDFDDLYEVGDTCEISFELKNVRVGGTTTQKSGGFGRKAKVVDGYEKTEKIIFGGEPPYDEDVESQEALIYSKKQIKSLKKDYEICWDAKLKKGRDDKGGSSSKPQGLGRRSAKVAEPTPQEEDLPFDIDDSAPINPFL